MGNLNRRKGGETVRAAIKQVEKINRLKKAAEKTKSIHLKVDYIKGTKRLTAELIEYCGYRGYDFNRIIKGDFSV